MAKGGRDIRGGGTSGGGVTGEGDNRGWDNRGGDIRGCGKGRSLQLGGEVKRSGLAEIYNLCNVCLMEMDPFAVYIVIGLFCIGAAESLYHCMSPFVALIPAMRTWR